MTRPFSSRLPARALRWPDDGPILRFVPAVFLFGAPALWLGATLGDGLPAVALTFAVFAVVAILALRGLWLFYPHRRLGLCNLVTLFRAALVAALAAVVVGPGPLQDGDAWAVAGLAAVTLALDGVDGWLARASGLVSGFGARFDMEVDSVFALILALVVWQSGKVGDWVLLLGAMRYLYVLAACVWPWLDAPIRRGVMRRKTVCVIQIAALVVLIVPVVVPPVSVAVAAVATLLLLWSFATDVVWLYRGTAG
jgi:phosphatidylglycerophosphate synthase